MTTDHLVGAAVLQQPFYASALAGRDSSAWSKGTCKTRNVWITFVFHFLFSFVFSSGRDMGLFSLGSQVVFMRNGSNQPSNDRTHRKALKVVGFF